MDIHGKYLNVFDINVGNDEFGPKKKEKNAIDSNLKHIDAMHGKKHEKKKNGNNDNSKDYYQRNNQKGVKAAVIESNRNGREWMKIEKDLNNNNNNNNHLSQTPIESHQSKEWLVCLFFVVCFNIKF